MTIPFGHRFEATQALRQVLARAVDWGLLERNPAKHGVDNPQRRRTEQRPFDTWTEIAAVATHLGPGYGPMIVFAAATGLRPSEWIALERLDVDRDARVVYVRRAFRNGSIRCTKTEASVRAVPLQAAALEALDRLPSSSDCRLPIIWRSWIISRHWPRFSASSGTPSEHSRTVVRVISVVRGFRGAATGG